MILNTYIAGPFDANNYLLMDKNTKEAVLIDCSEYKQEIIEDIYKLGAKVKYILLTHGHFDHILGVNKMTEALGVDAYINKEDVILAENINMMPKLLNLPMAEVPIINGRIEDWQEFQLGEHKIKAIPTPGHTEGGMSFLVDNEFLFSGDTLFCQSFGRTDLFGGNIKKLVNSIKNVLFELDDNIIVYPGHGQSTTIKFEKTYNEILNYNE
ncbi:predicted Zn-dependent hydrolase of metallo-beta-lactamase superfamily [Brachyspira sp. CAG:484]|nr:predicted Zn-dependent hydrolase of metallo-beta-lactamase superfamily [Brachyspira sp. CAG:484]